MALGGDGAAVDGFRLRSITLSVPTSITWSRFTNGGKKKQQSAQSVWNYVCMSAAHSWCGQLTSIASIRWFHQAFCVLCGPLDTVETTWYCISSKCFPSYRCWHGPRNYCFVICNSWATQTTTAVSSWRCCGIWYLIQFNIKCDIAALTNCCWLKPVLLKEAYPW